MENLRNPKNILRQNHIEKTKEIEIYFWFLQKEGIENNEFMENGKMERKIRHDKNKRRFEIEV